MQSKTQLFKRIFFLMMRVRIVFLNRWKSAIFLNLLILVCACNPTKRISTGEYLLSENKIIYKGKEIEKKEIETYIKQKPNKRILGFLRFRLWMYNRVDREKQALKKQERQRKFEESNARRILKNKKPKQKNRRSFNQVLNESLLDFGEAPVVLDSFLTEKSTEQIKLFFNSKGFFHSIVKDSVSAKGKKSQVFYLIQQGKPYKIRNLSYAIEDDFLKYFVFTDTINSLIKKGDNYDVDVLQNERDRVTKMLKNEGFFNFSKEYIYYKIDSSLNSNQMDISFGIKKYAQVVPEEIDSVIETNHQRYYINKIIVQTDFDPLNINAIPSDTIYYKNVVFTYHAPIKYKPSSIVDAILIHKNDLYQVNIAEDTYKRISELKSFKVVSISFKENPIQKDKLDCYIQLSPVLKQSFSIETEGINTSGNLGVAANLSYQNKNTFKGAEIFELKLKGSIEAQKSNGESANSNIGKNIPFNTIQFGPEATINIPRPLFPFNFFSYPEIAAPKSNFRVGLNYQRRPEYTRSITNLSYGITYKENIYKRHTFIPLEINLVKVNLTDSFEVRLNNIKDFILLNSFSNHFTTSSRYVFVYNNQDIKKTTNFSYFRGSFESSGNILRGINDLLGSPKDTVSGKDSYRIFNVIYSQYIRLDADYRFYKVINPQEKFVFRTAFGLGKPFNNLRVLPFEKSFFAGGSNGMRAWLARSLGPGSYKASQENIFNQIGDIQFETNLEYRFNVFKIFNGAFFVDVGNIWLRKPDPQRLNGEFDINRFYKEIAIGTGVGTRFDFSFFIIRLDLGIKVRDPKFDETNRWVIGHIFDRTWKSNYKAENSNRGYSFLNWNIGIGYPF